MFMYVHKLFLHLNNKEYKIYLNSQTHIKKPFTMKIYREIGKKIK